MNHHQFPLSYNQRGIYFLSQQLNDDTSYNIPVLLQLNDDVNLEILNQSINDLINLYPTLGVTIAPENNISPITLSLQPISIDNLLELNKYLTIPFNLSQPPLIRFYFIQSKDNKPLLFVVYHHIMTDDLPAAFWSDLKSIYHNKTVGKPNNIKSNQYSYADYVAWENDYTHGTQAQKDIAYWQDQLNNLPETVFQPFSSNNKTGYDAYKIIIPTALKHQLEAKAKHLHVSVYTLYVTSLYILLRQYLDQEQIAIKTVISQRFQHHFSDLLGDFTNSIILRQNVHDQSIESLIRKVAADILLMIKHGRLSFYKIKDQLDIRTEPSISMVYHHFKQIINAPDDLLHLKILHEICQLPRQDFNLEIIDAKDETILFFKYNETIFNKKDIKQIAIHYQQILHDIISTDNIQNIALHYPNEIKIIKQQFPCIHTLFEKRADEHPMQTAIQFGENQISYQHLNEQANQLARFIQNQLSISREAVIGIYLPNSIDAILVMLAILKIGACYLPLDPTYPLKRTLSLIENVNAKIIITNQQLINNISELNCINIENTDIVNHLNNYNIDTPVSSSQLAYIMHTSGTTGKPNAVAIKHASVTNLSEAQGNYFNIQLNTKVLQFASLAFDASTSEIWCTLLRGGTLCIPPSRQQLIGSNLIDFIRQHHINVATIPPSILSTIEPGITSIHTLILAGETAQPSLMQKWRQFTRIINAYGPTEATVCATMHEYQEGDLNTNIGEPINHVNIYILNRQMKPVPIGVIGEIYIGGMGVARGYYNNESSSTQKFISLPSSDVLYKTGDRGRFLTDGSIEFRGRLDTQVKIRGFRIEIEEIENILSQASHVSYATIVVDNQFDEARLIAFIVPNNELFNINELKQFASSRLPKHMLPNDYHILDKIPLTNSDKVDKKQLLSLISPSQPQQMSISSEKVFIDMCAEILKINHSKINLHSNFFDLGGTSLTILKFISKIKKNYGKDISIQTVFNAKSLYEIFNTINIHEATSSYSTEETQLIENDLKINIHSALTNQVNTLSASGKQSILLTGANGFLGSYLLLQLLKSTNTEIYCLVRSSREKIIQQLHTIEASDIPHERIHVILGDLSLHNFGLSFEQHQFLCQHIDLIFHCGALVNHIYPYSALRKANVLSTVELLKMASLHKLKPIHYISTIDTITSASQHFDSENNALDRCTLNWGYIQSKWVSEKILAQSNVPFIIYRPGNITGHSRTGMMNPEKNHACHLMKLCIESGLAPSWDTHVEMTPVDWLSDIIIQLAMKNQPGHLFYNLHNPHAISWIEYIHLLNEYEYPIKLISPESWKNEFLSQLNNNHPFSVFKSIYSGNELEKLTLRPDLIKNSRLIHLDYMRDYKSLIYNYLNFFKKIGYIL